jgi:two-component system LytT family sensor kinase
MMALWAGLVLGSLLIGLGSGLLAAQVASGRDALLIVLLNAVYWLGWGLLAIAVVWLGRHFPLAGRRRLRALAVHLAASVGVSLLHLTVFAIVSSVLRASWDGVAVSWPDAPLTRRQFEWELTMYWACTGLAHLVSSREEQRASQLMTAQLEAELAQARLVALQQQIQPHFIFNTLHTVMAVMHRDVDTASRLVEALGDVVRAALKADRKGMASLADELEVVRGYLLIEQINRGPQLRTSIAVEDGLADALLPQLMLQPLVENAIRHGCANLSGGGDVQVAACRRGDHLEISVRDNGAGFRSGPGGFGIALANIRSRLHLMYGDQHHFEVAPAPGGGVHASLTVPLRFAA